MPNIITKWKKRGWCNSCNTPQDEILEIRIVNVITELCFLCALELKHQLTVGIVVRQNKKGGK